MEWIIVTVIIALGGLGVTVVKPIISLTQSITKLTTVLDALSDDVGELTTKTSRTHERIFEKVNDHETRITVLENR